MGEDRSVVHGPVRKEYPTLPNEPGYLKSQRQRTGKLLRELFAILLAHPEGLQARDALRELAAKVPPTEHEKGIYKTGGD